MSKDWGFHFSARINRLLTRSLARIRVLGIPQVPGQGSLLVAANHISHFDPFFAGPPLGRPVDFMAMEEFFEWPLAGRWMRWVGAIPVKRGADFGATRELLRRAREGRLLFIFPERGIRTGPASMLEGASPSIGTMAFAHRLDLPVLPCVVLGTDQFYDWKKWFTRPRVWIAFGEPLRPRDFSDAEALQESYLRVLRELYDRLRREHGVRPDELPMTPQRRKGRPDPAPADR
ncbi:MAG: 1-acyl-sn-glycerol-3-phosphate acyltransferase [Verrucomicrobiae bacterium]|nr:1-acyl-sn-glycerol-3-phosphate acyltransferase [Verrucomicrobiae bacterium]